MMRAAHFCAGRQFSARDSRVRFSCLRHRRDRAGRAHIAQVHGLKRRVHRVLAPLSVVRGNVQEIDHRPLGCGQMATGFVFSCRADHFGYPRRFFAERATATIAALRRRANCSHQLYSHQASHSHKIASSVSNSTLNSVPIVRLQHLIRTLNSSMNETGHTGHRV
jgi:hypothetical protein